MTQNSKGCFDWLGKSAIACKKVFRRLMYSFEKARTVCLDFLFYSGPKKIGDALQHSSHRSSEDGLVEMLLYQNHWYKNVDDCLLWQWWKDLSEITYEDQQWKIRTENLRCTQKNGFSGIFGSLDCSDWKLNCSAVPDQRKAIGKSGTLECKIWSWVDDRLWIRQL